MPKHTKSDLHCHLNGSFSLDFLRRTAEKNKCLPVFDQYVQLRKEYLEKTQHQPDQGFPPEVLGMVWKHFDLIHHMIRDLNDICSGVLDVINCSSAKYLEIRTTPKAMSDQSLKAYIIAFETGLLRAQHEYSSKRAIGLLSLDRTQHTAKDAQILVEAILASPNHVLAGLDISGNPWKQRTLTGNELVETIQLVLRSGLALAIHMGEADTDMDKKDTDTILATLAAWKAAQPHAQKNPLHGRVRLGHCIYLTEQQKEILKLLQLPIEVCPTCHAKLNWHIEKKPHPVTAIYPDLSQPVIVGTDDELIFGANAQIEFSKVLCFFSNNQKLSRAELKDHQAQFRFTPN
jgi:adenosine deaminase